MISINLIPNFGTEEISLAVKMLFSPWIFWQTKYQKLLTERLKHYLKIKHCFLFDSGRTSLYFLLQALGVGKDDEVIIQAFTCSVVPAAIINGGATPIYIDIDENYNLDPKKIEEKISPKTKALIIQHTFGKAADIETIAKICLKFKIALIEDCAHSLGGEFKKGKLGAFGKAAFFSFGRDKVISGIWGGAITTNDALLAAKLQNLTQNYPQRGFFWSVKQLIYIPLVFLAMQTYDFFNLGKFLHWFFRKAKLVDDAVSCEDKKCLPPKKFYRGLPEFQAKLVCLQLAKIEEILRHRKKMAGFYARELNLPFDEDSTYLRFSFERADAENIRIAAAKKNIFLGNWYNNPIAPKDIDLEKFGYNKGECPKAEKSATRILNLPTNPNLSLKEAERIVKLFPPKADRPLDENC